MSSEPHLRDVDSDEQVTPLELFFDLVFVFALTQVTTFLLSDLTAVGFVRGMAVLAVMWWAWTGYAWLTNSVAPHRGLDRLIVLGAMAAMAVVALASPGAFGNYAVLFAVAYFVVRLLHVVLYIAATVEAPELRRAVLRLSPGMVVAPALLVVASFLDIGPVRPILWVLALVVDYGSPLVAGTEGWRIHPGHFAERHGLVIIIALGESVVQLGIGASRGPLTSGVVISVILGVGVVAALWWLYFDVVAIVAEQRMTSLKGRARAAMARDSYSYLHFVLIAGIMFLALGLRTAAVDIKTTLGVFASLSLFGGAALYLLGHIAFRLRNVGTLNRQRLVAAAVLAALIPLGSRVPAVASMLVLTAVLWGLVSYEVLKFRDARQLVREHPEQIT